MDLSGGQGVAISVHLCVPVISCLEHSILHISLLGLSQAGLFVFFIGQSTEPKILGLLCECVIFCVIFSDPDISGGETCDVSERETERCEY